MLSISPSGVSDSHACSLLPAPGSPQSASLTAPLGEESQVRWNLPSFSPIEEGSQPPVLTR